MSGFLAFPGGGPLIVENGCPRYKSRKRTVQAVEKLMNTGGIKGPRSRCVRLSTRIRLSETLSWTRVINNEKCLAMLRSISVLEGTPHSLARSSFFTLHRSFPFGGCGLTHRLTASPRRRHRAGLYRRPVCERSPPRASTVLFVWFPDRRRP